MKQFLAKIAQRLAPRTVMNLRKLNALDPKLGSGVPQLISYERELRVLRRQIDELRWENGVSLSCTTSSSSWRNRMWERQCLLLTFMLLEPSSESPMYCPRTPSPIHHPTSRGS